MAEELSAEQWKKIDESLFAGQKIQAIKEYRELTDAGLAEAKDAVEKRDAQLREKFPTRMPAKSGCMGMILLVASAVAMLYAALR